MLKTFNLFTISLLRDKLAITLLILILCSNLLSLFFGYIGIVEQGETGITFATGISRLVIVIGSILFFTNHINKLYTYREIQIMLSRSISRNQFIIEYFINITFFALMVTCLNAIVILTLFTPHSYYNMIFWSFGQFCELLIISLFAFICNLIINNVIVSSLIGILFYGFARINGFILMISADNFLASTNFKFYTFKVYNFCSLFIPRFDLFCPTTLLLKVESISNYSINSVITITVAYVLFLFAIGIYDFNKKEF